MLSGRFEEHSWLRLAALAGLARVVGTKVNGIDAASELAQKLGIDSLVLQGSDEAFGESTLICDDDSDPALPS